MAMKLVCCDCKILITEVPPYESDAITHSYCEPCFMKALQQLDEFIENHPKKQDQGKIITGEDYESARIK